MSNTAIPSRNIAVEQEGGSPGEIALQAKEDAKGKKRILLVNLWHRFSGGEIYVTRLAKLLKPHASVYALCGSRELAEKLADVAVAVHCVPARLQGVSGISYLFGLLSLPLIIVRNQIDTVQFNLPLESILLLVAKVLGRRTVTTRHVTSEINSRNWFHHLTTITTTILYHRLANFADVVVCVSNAVRQDLGTYVNQRKTIVIPNWVDSIPHLRPRRLDTDWRRRECRLLYVGRLEKHKGIEDLLNVVCKMRGVCLDVLGEGPLRTHLQNTYESPSICFRGFQGSPNLYFEKADIFIMPSRGPEGLPLVSLEAMSHGLTCILSDLPVHKEISGDGKAAILFRAGSSSALKEKLELAIERFEESQALGKVARQRILDLYSAEQAERSYISIFQLEALADD